MKDLDQIIQNSGHKLGSFELAESLDAQDKFNSFRNEFIIPSRKDVATKQPVIESQDDLEKPCTYLCGNSLGLMPKRSRELVYEELDAWGRKGIEGQWSHPYQRPWATMDERVKGHLANIVGAKPVEVTSMNTLTVNIHIMLTTFYQPSGSRFKILIEKKAFPSDHYAITSHLQSRGIDPEIGLLLIAPRPGEHTLRTEDIIDLIQKDKDIALVMLSGIQYYTGQFFEMEKITKAGHDAGCIVGWDLAHAVGNVPLQLHDWGVDFACWCTYKYLNSGPGGIGGLFVHEKYKNDTSRPRMAGWWGYQKETRFDMLPDFVPSEGASGFQVSTPSAFTTISLLGSLEVFEAAGGVSAVHEKSRLLTGYLEQLLQSELSTEFKDEKIRILTPSDPNQRGCQLSLEIPEYTTEVFDGLCDRGIVVDKRKPTVIRVAPAPLYNTFKDVHRFVMQLKEVMQQVYH